MIEFERREGEVTVVQLTSGDEITLGVKSLTPTKAVLTIEPGDVVKRVMKLEQTAKPEAK